MERGELDPAIGERDLNSPGEKVNSLLGRGSESTPVESIPKEGSWIHPWGEEQDSPVGRGDISILARSTHGKGSWIHCTAAGRALMLAWGGTGGWRHLQLCAHPASPTPLTGVFHQGMEVFCSRLALCGFWQNSEQLGQCKAEEVWGQQEVLPFREHILG